MIRRVKWLEFAGKGKDLAGMTADTANTPHRGISATSASSTPSSGDCARQRGGICSAAARLHRSLAARRGGPCKAGKRKPGMPGFCACGRPSGKQAFPSPWDSDASRRHPRPPAAGRCKTDKRKPGGTPPPHRGISATSASPPHRGFRRFAPASPPACGGLCRKPSKNPAQVNLAGFFATFLR